MKSSYIQLGISHITDLGAYDHMLFVALLVCGVQLSKWKQLLLVITAFTLGHSITLALSVLEIVKFPGNWIEFLIPVTILLTALSNLFQTGGRNTSRYLMTVFFGLIHGMGFAGYLSQLLPSSGSLLVPLLSFNIGVEIGQVIIALVVWGFLKGIQFITENTVQIAQKGISIVGIAISLLLALQNWPL